MRREEKFVQSHAPYAVDLDSLATETIGEYLATLIANSSEGDTHSTSTT